MILILYSIAIYCIVLSPFLLYCNILYCNIIYIIVLFFVYISIKMVSINFLHYHKMEIKNVKRLYFEISGYRFTKIHPIECINWPIWWKEIMCEIGVPVDRMFIGPLELEIGVPVDRMFIRTFLGGLRREKRESLREG